MNNMVYQGTVWGPPLWNELWRVEMALEDLRAAAAAYGGREARVGSILRVQTKSRPPSLRYGVQLFANASAATWA